MEHNNKRENTMATKQKIKTKMPEVPHEATVENGNGVKDPTVVLEQLKQQLELHLKQSESSKQMALKVQGAIEILAQMYPEAILSEG